MHLAYRWIFLQVAKKAFDAVARKSISNISTMINQAFQGNKRVICVMQCAHVHDTVKCLATAL